ncbi:hypothetical protein A9977_28670 [Variovorax sp. UMC13]|nr:hypothetical protein [Variovorax sp. UMC13]
MGHPETETLQALLEAQRLALAREVHDDIGGALTALHFDLSQVLRHPDAAEAPERLRSAQEALRQAIDATQRVVHDLYPPDLDDGLDAALRGLAERFRRRTGLATAVTGSIGDAVLPAALQLAAYRTVQEALSNVARHAQGRRVDIALDTSDSTLRVAVQDDGRGITPEAAPDDRPSFGLRGLAGRAQSVGGCLHIDSALGTGTTVTLVAPLAQGAPA